MRKLFFILLFISFTLSIKVSSHSKSSVKINTQVDRFIRQQLPELANDALINTEKSASEPQTYSYTYKDHSDSVTVVVEGRNGQL